MFGDEPYGNYNRILLSNVLNGTQDPADIFLNPLEWYTENNVTLHAPARVTQIDRARKEICSDDGQGSKCFNLIFFRNFLSLTYFCARFGPECILIL